jgi:hypothetical protein
MRRALAAGTAVTLLALGPAAAVAAAPKKITAAGVGQVKLGMTFHDLRAQHLIGKLRHGCEFAGPDFRTARLRSPLRGFVDFPTQPRKASNITITRGARARGVGIGDTIADIKAKFPKAHVHHSTESVFGLTLVVVPKNGGGRISFSVPLATHKIDMIGVPNIPFCD